MRRKLLALVTGAIILLTGSSAWAYHATGQYWLRTDAINVRQISVRMEFESPGVNHALVLDRALNDWEASGVVSFTVTAYNASGGDCNPTDVLSVQDGRIRICSTLNDLGNGSLGWATVDGPNGGNPEITSGLIGFRRDVSWDGPSFRHALCHEIGHVLGLNHSNDVISCMGSNFNWRVPDVTDLQEVNEVWTNAL